MDGLIVSKEQADWRGEEEEEDTEQSMISAQGTLTTLRYYVNRERILLEGNSRDPDLTICFHRAYLLLFLLATKPNELENYPKSDLKSVKTLLEMC